MFDGPFEPDATLDLFAWILEFDLFNRCIQSSKSGDKEETENEGIFYL